jgi:HAD superfamily hydrolase (TIGR01484 family)
MGQDLLRMLVCDLDGTLLMHGAPFDPRDVRALRGLASDDVVRVIATGRALATARKVIAADFPIDYLIFSSGAGVLDWRTQELLAAHSMRPDEVAVATAVFVAHELDFMIHAPVPEQHIFRFHRTGRSNADFERRLARYVAEGRVLETPSEGASQLLAVYPQSDAELVERLRRALPHLSLIRATSPLDGRSMWIEAFAPTVSKSQAAARIAQQHSIAPEHVWAIGNDYNDWDLLRWAGRAAVVTGAPESMCAELMTVSSVSAWLSASASTD